MRVLGAEDIARRAADWPSLVDAAERALVALASGACHAPVRTAIPLIGAGTLLTMPGRLHGATTAMVKLVSVVPANSARGQPTIQGVAIVFDAATGQPIASLDGAALTAVRTGAVSAAAARRLAPPGTEVLAVLGAGGQAPWQARALAAVCHGLARVHVWSPTPASREQLARELAADLHAEVRAVDRVEEATRDAAIVCCATTARTPFLRADMLRSGPVLVVAIGAFQPDMAEVDPSVFARAGRVYVDDGAAVRHEAGDVLAALAADALRPDDVIPIGRIMEGTATRSGPTPRDLAIFKSVGSAVEDAAVAAALISSP